VSRNVRELNCRPEHVFRVFADGWLFPSWVVGASRMRDVGADWPQAGASLQHSFGVWPVLIDDSTTVLEYDPPRRFAVQARGWPMGAARVSIEVKERGDDDLRGRAPRIGRPPLSWCGSTRTAMLA